MVNLIDAPRRLSELRKLPIGWDYGQGGPISSRAFNSGRILVQLLARLGSEAFDVVPGDGDGVVIVAYNGGKSAEIHCLTNGRYDLLHEVNDEENLCKENLSIAGLLFLLESLGWQSRRFYASCTRSAMFRVSDDSPQWLSGTPLLAACQSLAQTVLPTAKPAPVSTSVSSTKKVSAVNRQSSGEYLSLPFQMALA